MIKRITEDGLADDATRATRSKEQQALYRRDLFGQMDYERRKKEEVKRFLFRFRRLKIREICFV